MTDANDIADRLRDMADELDAVGEGDLPEINGYQMVAEWDPAITGSVYRDEDGDVWIDTENGRENLCLGAFAEKFVDAIREANVDE